VVSTAIRIGSRDSQLALVQSHWVRAELQKIYPDYEFPLLELKTQGDKILDVALAKIGDKGLFTKELEVSMLEGATDFAVHSLKDLPTELPEGLALAVVTERENPADALVLHSKHKGQTLDTLAEGTVLGTSSLRRLAQLRHHYPHLVFKDIRGNLNTRLRKLDAGDFDGIVLAVAGLQRLGWADRIDQIIPGDISLHAVGQGALGIECRAADKPVIELLQVLNHRSTEVCCRAERAMLRTLEGGCQVPIGVSTFLEGETLTLEGMVASLDGKTLIRDKKQGLASDPEALGQALAESLRDQGASEILANIRL
jgi:hydroxymethylbilane synthase